VHRILVLALLVLSIALMGGSTCHFRTSSGGKKNNNNREGSGVAVVVDTRTSSSSGAGAGAGAGTSTGVVAAALGASVLSLSLDRFAAAALPRSQDRAASGLRLEGLEGDGLGATPGPERALSRSDVEGLAPRSVVRVSLPERGRTGVPEPAAGWLFAGGVTLMGWRLRRRPHRAR
jgi:hypothetical protein